MVFLRLLSLDCLWHTLYFPFTSTWFHDLGHFLFFFIPVTESNVIYFDLGDSKTHGEEFILAKVDICFKLSMPPFRPSVLLSLYDVMAKEKVSEKEVPSAPTQQWVRFPVRSLVYRWLLIRQSNHGVQVVTEVPIAEGSGQFNVPVLFINTGHGRVLDSNHIGRYIKFFSD